MLSGALKWLWPTKIGIWVAGFIAGVVATNYFQEKSYNNRVESQKEIIANLSNERDRLTSEMQRFKDENSKAIDQNIARIEHEYKLRIDLQNERLSIITRERDSLNDEYNKLYQTYLLTLQDRDRQAERSTELSNLRKQEQELQQKIDGIIKKMQTVSDEIGKSEQPCNEYKEGKNFYFASSNDCENLNKAKYQLETLKQGLEFYKTQIFRLRENIATASK